MGNLFKPGDFVRRVGVTGEQLGVVQSATTSWDSVNGYVFQSFQGERVLVPTYKLEPFDLRGLTGEEFKKHFKSVIPIAWFGGLYNGGQSGTDPEVFAFDDHGEVIPAWKWLQTKEANPAFYWDGVQAELTTAPKSCHEYLTDEVRTNLSHIFKALRTYNKTGVLRAQDVVELDEKTLQLEDDKHIMLGCSPSRNIYDEIQPIEIPNPRTHKFRYSGTHLHYSDMSTQPPPDWFPHGTVAMMDKIGGILLTAMGRDVENPLRRKAYGRPGEYRLPSQIARRLEYRTPGAFLLQHPAMFHFGADMCRAAYRLGQIFDGRREDVLPNEGYKEIIMGCDADGALKYIKNNKDVFERVMINCAATKYTPETIRKTWSILSKGIKKFGIYDKPLHENWNLTRSYPPEDGKWRLFCTQV